LKRLKQFYEADNQETKKGVAGGKASGVARNKGTTAHSAVVPGSFTKTTAEKINKSERTIREEVQVATRIPEKVQMIIKDLPVADNKSDLLKLSRLNETGESPVSFVKTTGRKYF
jgi:hypothetical protein